METGNTQPIPASPCQRKNKNFPLTRGIEGVWRKPAGFTLVELVVVITIMGILSVIALMGYSGFSESSRDAVRLSHIGTVSQTLEEYAKKNAHYPSPDNATSITWSGSVAWHQGTIGDSLAATIKLSPKLADPSYGVEYAYSVTTNGKQYQLASVSEKSLVADSGNPFPQAIAAAPLSAIVRGTYNQVTAPVSGLNNATSYIAVPSIILSDLSKTDLSLSGTFSTGAFVIDKRMNFPASYSGAVTKASGDFYFTPKLLGTATGSLSTADLTALMEQAKLAYSGSVLTTSMDNTVWKTVATTASGSDAQTAMAKGIFSSIAGGSALPTLTPQAAVIPPYSVANSLMLDSGNSQYLSRTPSVAGNQQKWTWSGWVKRGVLGAEQHIFEAGAGATNQFYFSAGDTLNFYENGATKYSTQVFRDPSAWMHIALVWDSSNGIAGDRVRMYVNGWRITSFSLTNDPTLWQNSTVNTTSTAHYHGKYNGGALWYLGGYLSDVSFVDSGALDPTAFAQTDLTTGQWLPKAYTGTYGTNGFHLSFLSGAALGTDSSGNGNTWTTNGTMTAANNQMIDTPNNNFAVLNPLMARGGVNSSAAIMTKGNLSVDCQNVIADNFAFGSTQVAAGKFYWETTIKSLPSAGYVMVGVDGGLMQNDVLTDSVYYRSDTGHKGIANADTAYGSSFVVNDVIGVALDKDGGTVTFYKNNVSQWVITLPTTVSLGAIFRSYKATTDGMADINFWQHPFAYTPPTGFKSLSTANLPTPTIVKPNQYFDAVTYTGNGSAQTISSLGFQPDLVWIKSRNFANYGSITDSVRGTSKQLSSHGTAGTSAEYTNTNTITAFNANGFNVGTSDYYDVNSNNSSEVAWSWKAGGTAVANTAGSIASQVSANPTAGFSIVTWTGNGTAGATVGHGLSSAPKMVIVKNRDSTTYSWGVWHVGLAATEYLLLNNTGAKQTGAMWNNTAANSSVVTLGANTWGVNDTSNKMVAYLWSEVPGFSKFGSYTGNGGWDGPFVYTGFKPRYVMVKRTDVAGYDWVVLDTSRDGYNPAGNDLYPDLPSAEVAGVNRYDFLSNGFKTRTIGNNFNTSGGTYIYAAFAEAPFKYANAR